MNSSTFLIYAAAVLETIFLCVAMYYLIRGIKTKNFGKAWIFVGLYLVLNMIRRLGGF